MGNSALISARRLSEEEKKYGVTTNVTPIKNSPLNNYIGFSTESNINRNDSSSSLSLNTLLVTTSVHDSAKFFRVAGKPFREHKRIAVVVHMGCGNIELTSSGAAVLKEVKRGAAAVVDFLESGGIYCQEA